MSRRVFAHFRLVAAVVVALAASAGAQERSGSTIDPAPPRGITPEQIIQRFAAKEKEFKAAREKYTWRQHVKVETLEGGQPDGRYEQVVDILFDDRGRRTENVIYAPVSTLQRIQMTKEDLEDIEKLYPFVLTTEELPLYNVRYLGRQKVDELDTYVFDVGPRQIEKGRRYFEGRIWVDDRDLQIVKTYGKPVPDIRGKQENLFPRFTTYREQVSDGPYWFPTYTRANEELQFSSGAIPIRITVRYTNYKRYGSESKIIFDGQELPEGQQQKPPQQKPPAE